MLRAEDTVAGHKLSAQQQAFIDHLLADPAMNATAAYKRAYPRCRSDAAARANAARLLTNANVQEALQAAQAQRAQRCEVSVDRVLRELAAVAFSDLGQLIDFGADGFRFRAADQVPEAARRALSSIKVRRDLGSDTRPPSECVELKLWDKVSALEKLGKHLGLFQEAQVPPVVVVVEDEHWYGNQAHERAAAAEGTPPSDPGPAPPGS